MQQKYWDQGRSTALLTTTCPICLARSSCGCGGKPRKASIFSSASSRVTRRRDGATQLTSLPRVQAHVGQHAGEEDVSGAGAQRRSPPPSFPSGHGWRAPARSQTTRSSQHGPPASRTIGCPASTWMRSGPTKSMLMCDLAGGQGPEDSTIPSCLDVLHLREPLAWQELFGHILGGYTEAGAVTSVSLVVSGGGSAATSLGFRPRSPAVPASVSPPKNFRRLKPSPCLLIMGISSQACSAASHHPPAGQAKTPCRCNGNGNTVGDTVSQLGRQGA